MMSDELKNYVEDKIITYTFHAKNFSREDMERVDDYCKIFYGNDRKKMILTLISLVENNTGLDILNDKINLLSANMQYELESIKSRLPEKKEEENKDKVSWKGFKKDAN